MFVVSVLRLVEDVTSCGVMFVVLVPVRSSICSSRDSVVPLGPLGLLGSGPGRLAVLTFVSIVVRTFRVTLLCCVLCSSSCDPFRLLLASGPVEVSLISVLLPNMCECGMLWSRVQALWNCVSLCIIVRKWGELEWACICLYVLRGWATQALGLTSMVVLLVIYVLCLAPPSRLVRHLQTVCRRAMLVSVQLVRVGASGWCD